MEKRIRILALAGSLRKMSYNRGILRKAVEIAPSHCSIEIVDLGGIPLFNQDQEKNPPDEVAQFKAKIRAAQAILIATPEHNYSIPSVLKNAIDWASRPLGDNAWAKKPVAIMGASPGAFGTSRAQYHLRQIFVTLDMYPLNKPEVMIGSAQSKFDETGNLTDAKTIEKIGELLSALIDWTQKLS